MVDLCLPLSAGVDTVELHSVQLELEAVGRQIHKLLGKQAQLRKRKATLETSRADTHKSGVSMQRAANTPTTSTPCVSLHRPSAPGTRSSQMSFTLAPGNPGPWISFENHISHVTKTAFFHLRNIAKLQNMLTVSDEEKLIHAFMTSRLDYCNALLGGCPASSINKLQIVQNAAARVLTRSRKYDHITPILQSLHWLPSKFRISYKLLLQ